MLVEYEGLIPELKYYFGLFSRVCFCLRFVVVLVMLSLVSFGLFLWWWGLFSFGVFMCVVGWFVLLCQFHCMSLHPFGALSGTT